MKCINCGGDMTETAKGTGAHSRCSACGRLWLRPASIEAITGKQFIEIKYCGAFRPTPNRLICPTCGIDLVATSIRHDNKIFTVEYCIACKGISLQEQDFMRAPSEDPGRQEITQTRCTVGNDETKKTNDTNTDINKPLRKLIRGLVRKLIRTPRHYH